MKSCASINDELVDMSKAKNDGIRLTIFQYLKGDSKPIYSLLPFNMISSGSITYEILIEQIKTILTDLKQDNIYLKYFDH